MQQLYVSESQTETNSIEYYIKAGDKHLLISEAGSNQISLISSEKPGEIAQLDFEEEGTEIKGISVNPDFTEFCVLFSYQEEGLTQKKASLGYIVDDTLEDFDILEIPDQVESIRYVSNQDYLLAEGEHNFFVFETRNSELTNNIKSKISSAMNSLQKSDDSTPFSPEKE